MLRRMLLLMMMIAFVVVVASPAAFAQGPAPAASSDTSPSLADELSGTAKSEYLAGRALFNDGDFAGALVKFQSALDASKDNRLFWNLGVCHRSLRHYAEAIRSLDRFVAEGGPRVTDAQRADAKEFIAGLRPYVAAVTVRASETGATVLIDEKEVGPTPLEKYLVDLGAHKVVVRKATFADKTSSIDVTGTADIVLDIKLPHEGRLLVRAGAGDAIALDGKAIGSGSYEGAVASGSHRLRVSAPGKKNSDTDFVIEDGQLRTFDISLDRDGLLPTWAWIGIGTAAATGVAVIAYLLFSPPDPKRPDAVPGSMDPFVVTFK